MSVIFDKTQGMTETGIAFLIGGVVFASIPHITFLALGEYGSWSSLILIFGSGLVGTMLIVAGAITLSRRERHFCRIADNFIFFGSSSKNRQWNENVNLSEITDFIIEQKIDGESIDTLLFLGTPTHEYEILDHHLYSVGKFLPILRSVCQNLSVWTRCSPTVIPLFGVELDKVPYFDYSDTPAIAQKIKGILESLDSRWEEGDDGLEIYFKQISSTDEIRRVQFLDNKLIFKTTNDKNVSIYYSEIICVRVQVSCDYFRTTGLCISTNQAGYLLGVGHSDASLMKVCKIFRLYVGQCCSRPN